ncbi:hypothetical protein Hanom_Chr01g00002151 [Helianthus anomalus]
MVPMVYQILDLVPSFPKVHGWSLWFALCNAFSRQSTNLKVQTTRTICVLFEKVGD